MPEPTADPRLPQVRRVAIHALAFGIGITAIKFAVFALTDSVAVLTDAIESIINIVAAAAMLYAVIIASRPPDEEHPYGHGRAEVLAVWVEGWLMVIAGLFIAWHAVMQIVRGDAPERLGVGLMAMGGVAVLTLALGVYVYSRGRRYASDPLIADGKHLLVDAGTTLAVLGGLAGVKLTGIAWLDPLVAIGMTLVILFTSSKLLWQASQGVMERVDPEDLEAIHSELERAVGNREIRGYHKVRYRHVGPFHWVDMHLQVEPGMSVAEGHELASRIERRIEGRFEQANATAHLEPAKPREAVTEPPEAPEGTQATTKTSGQG
ncbi:MAG: cation diffusion facilitator family transporter [Phycisphaeraceae bacterium]